MHETYELLLGQEIAAWEALEALARQQRQAIVTRQAQRVDDLRADLRERLRLALLAHQQTLQARPSPVEDRHAVAEAAVDRAQEAARDAIRFNLELLRDTCSYLEMMRCAVAPDGAPAAYGQGRHPRVVAAAARRVA